MYCAITTAMINASVPAVTAMSAAKTKGFAPSFEMLLNLTLDPTPAKAVVSDNFRSPPESWPLSQNQPRLAAPVLRVASRKVPSKELTMNRTPNRGSTSFVFFPVSELWALMRYVAVRTAGPIMNIRTDLMSIAGRITSVPMLPAAAITWAVS